MAVRKRFVEKLVEAVLVLSSAGNGPPNKTRAVGYVADAYPDLHKIISPTGRKDGEVPSKEEWSEVWKSVRVVPVVIQLNVEFVQQKLALREIVCADSEVEIPYAAATLFRRIVLPGASLTQSCGKTLLAMNAHLAGLDRNLTVYSSVVLAGPEVAAIPPSAVVNALVRRNPSHVKGLSYHLPDGMMDLLQGSPGQKREQFRGFLNTRLFDAAARADFHFVGVGVLNENSSFPAHVDHTEARDELVKSGMTGEAMCWPFTAEGDFVYDTLGLPERQNQGHMVAWEKIAGTSLERFFNRTFTLQWHKMRVDSAVVVVAGGAQKHEALYVMLTSPWRRRHESTYLVTDSETVLYLRRRLEQR